MIISPEQVQEAIDSAFSDVETWLHSAACEEGEDPSDAWFDYYWAWVQQLETDAFMAGNKEPLWAKTKYIRRVYRCWFDEKARGYV